MSTEPDTLDAMDGDSSPVCPACLAPLPTNALVCPKCLAPVDSIATLDPIGRVWSYGHIYSRATRGPRSLVVPLGATAIGGPVAIGWIWAIAHLISGGEPAAETGFAERSLSVLLLPVGVAYGVWLFKVWANYFRSHRSAGDSATEVDDAD